MFPRLAFLQVAILLAAGTAAHAAASAWREEQGAQVRLIAAARQGSGPYRAGLEIMLDPGVKTYWRTPGEAGVPPLFDWSKSKNLAQAEVAWPAPQKFDDAGSTGFGYAEHVIFPIEVTPKDGAQPVDLDLDLDFAVCKELCIPVRAELSLALKPDAAPDPATEDALELSRRRVPMQVAIGDPGMVRVQAVRLDREATPPALEIVLGALGGAAPELFVETPDGWPAARPVQTGADAGRYTFRVPLPKFSGEKGARVVITAVTAGQAIELAVDPAEVAGE